MMKITPVLLLLAFPLFCDKCLTVEVGGDYEALFRSLNALVSEPRYVQDLATKIGRAGAGQKLAEALQNYTPTVDTRVGSALCGLCKVRKRSDHDAKFVVTSGNAGCRYDSLRCTSDDKVGIITTLVFKWSWAHFINNVFQDIIK